jgi:acetyl esterase
VELDSDVRSLLDMLANSGQPKLWDLTPAVAREMVRLFSKMLERKERIGDTETRAFPELSGPLAFRLYTPLEASDQPTGGIIYFHGGAWIVGDLDTHDGLCRALANESGCRVISVDYRLAPEHKFPAAVYDAYAATKWVADHAMPQICAMRVLWEALTAAPEE